MRWFFPVAFKILPKAVFANSRRTAEHPPAGAGIAISGAAADDPVLFAIG